MDERIIAKTYDPKKVEDKTYDMWMDRGYFRAEIDNEKEPYCIIMPPPNITGSLHIGHALDGTLQDILTRWKRMEGYSALWLPGTDHASIATEVKIIEQMAKEGITKNDLGREGFLERAWEWKEKYGGQIVEQFKKLGSSCDWSRERFTMDEGCSEAVTEVFIRLYEEDLIYRGDRIINWCPDCKTALSDAEVEHEEDDGNFWHIKYPVVDSDRYLTIATTRPETMLGDTAVAVHPDDERYKDLIGKTAMLPLMDREIPIIADDYVDSEFGTGIVKITPAHDPNDFEIGLRHGLEQIRIMDDGGNMNENAGIYEGMDRYEARRKIVEDLKELKLLKKVEDHRHNVGHCYRCSSTVEPIISRQWFVKMKPLAKPAIEEVKNGNIKFVPQRFEKIYFNWMENIRDWCISRQLWWGHRIPAYYCNDCDETVVSSTAPVKCPKCGSKSFKQDEDVLDTWFSSALWPFSTLGWPEQTEDLKYFYPTDVLVTGYDIIFFWVARMIFSGLEHMDEIPFEYVFIHGMVRDAKGRHMSKSLGNGIDPLEVIDKYGADALRLSLVTGISPGNDMRFHWEKVEASRNFTNKIWNAARFILMNIEDNASHIQPIDTENLELSDRWILSKYNNLVAEVTENMERFELGIAAQKIYDFTWSEFCDWYIELAKPRLYGEDVKDKEIAISTLVYVLSNTLKLLHPFIPFVTEEIWQHLPQAEESIMISKWPEFNRQLVDSDAQGKMEEIMDVIRAIRNIRAELEVPMSRKAKLNIVAKEGWQDIFEQNQIYFTTLAGIEEMTVGKYSEELAKNTATAVTTNAQIFMPLEDLIDFETELKRLNAEKQKLEKEVQRCQGKLGNAQFIENAPSHIVEKERKKSEEYEQMLANVLRQIDEIQELKDK
ncbi:MAG: valine--tRNA ligase [Clostridiales bacterium]|nr:valine--tRNA ligase [Clostridiales bacterium]